MFQNDHVVLIVRCMDLIGIPGSMGRLAVGPAFFNRQELIARAWDLLKTSNLLLLAPRRVGKSSLLNRMHEEGPSRGYNTLYLSIPDAEDELDFIKRLVRGFRDAEWASGGWVSAACQRAGCQARDRQSRAHGAG